MNHRMYWAAGCCTRVWGSSQRWSRRSARCTGLQSPDRGSVQHVPTQYTDESSQRRYVHRYAHFLHKCRSDRMPYTTACIGQILVARKLACPASEWATADAGLVVGLGSIHLCKMPLPNTHTQPRCCKGQIQLALGLKHGPYATPPAVAAMQPQPWLCNLLLPPTHTQP